MDNILKIEKGLEIQQKVSSLMFIVRDSYNHTGKQIDEAKEEIKKLWDTCEHNYKWIDCNPYNEICKCIYCGADSPNTRDF